MSTERVEQTARVGSPIFFTFSRVIFGNGFAADVTIPRGRALLVEEPDGIWVYGVNPGAIAGGGGSLVQAHGDFVTRLVSVLFDIANEARSFDGFRQQVEEFFNATVAEEEWTKAVGAVRAGTVSDTVATLPRVNADSGAKISITEIPLSFTFTHNSPPQFAAPNLEQAA
jgi:hypothetical protein